MALWSGLHRVSLSLTDCSAVEEGVEEGTRRVVIDRGADR